VDRRVRLELDRWPDAVHGVGWHAAHSSRSTRHSSELSRVYGSLARGEITSRDISAHEFGSELKRRLRGYLPMMSNGNWGLGNALTDGLA
jgi:hypothetical protein